MCNNLNPIYLIEGAYLNATGEVLHAVKKGAPKTLGQALKPVVKKPPVKLPVKPVVKKPPVKLPVKPVVKKPPVKPVVKKPNKRTLGKQISIPQTTLSSGVMNGPTMADKVSLAWDATKSGMSSAWDATSSAAKSAYHSKPAKVLGYGALGLGYGALGLGVGVPAAGAAYLASDK